MYDTVAIPVAMPVNTPVVEFIDANEGVLHDHVPPETGWDSEIESPAHTLPGPAMAPRIPTVNCKEAEQPEERV